MSESKGARGEEERVVLVVVVRGRERGEWRGVEESGEKRCGLEGRRGKGEGRGAAHAIPMIMLMICK